MSIYNDMKQHYTNLLPNRIYSVIYCSTVWLRVQEGPPLYSQMGVICFLRPCQVMDLISGEVKLIAEGHITSNLQSRYSKKSSYPSSLLFWAF